MKMETVIRSPQKGVVAKLVHKEGVCFPMLSNHPPAPLYYVVTNILQDICKAGTVLVLFEEVSLHHLSVRSWKRKLIHGCSTTSKLCCVACFDLWVFWVAFL